MRFVSRREWGAVYAKGSGPIPGPVLGVTCHWEGPRMGDFAHTQCALKVRSIERYHAVFQKWSGIAYNALVCPHGYVFEGRGTGIRSAANGTSNIGGNDQWYAVCYLGGVGDGFTADGRTGFSDAIGWLRTAGNAGQRVNGHRDHHPTECPGDAIYRWVKSGGPGSITPTPPEEPDMQLDDPISGHPKAVTVGEVLAEMHRFVGHSSQRERRMLRSLNGLPADVAESVLADLPKDLPGIEVPRLRRLVEAAARRAIDSRLGSLDEPDAP